MCKWVIPRICSILAQEDVDVGENLIQNKIQVLCLHNVQTHFTLHPCTTDGTGVCYWCHGVFRGSMLGWSIALYGTELLIHLVGQESNIPVKKTNKMSPECWHSMRGWLTLLPPSAGGQATKTVNTTISTAETGITQLCWVGVFMIVSLRMTLWFGPTSLVHPWAASFSSHSNKNAYVTAAI